MGFDVGALIFKIQAVGAQLFQRDLDQADGSIKKVEKSAKSAAAGLDGQGKATDDVGSKSRKASEDQKKQSQATEGQVQAAKSLSLALVASGLAITALVGMSVAKFTSFDAALSNVRAATMATTAEQKQLGAAALEAGADTAYSANEAAAAEEELAKAGLTVSEVVGGALTGALSLAAAGQLQVARSGEIMATTLKQYKLPAEQAAHVSDVLAAGAGKAQGSVDDLALALQYVGPVTAGLGISLEETAGTLAYFASEGQKGERAGTGLRGVLMALTAPSAAASGTMKQYGIEIFDSSGKMKSLSEVSQILKDRLSGLTEAERSAALGRIFGNEQITAARILYAGGAAAVDKWTAAVDDSGYAAEQAAARQDNLAGDIEKLGGAFDTALIKTGSGANDILRDMVQIITALVDGYGELPSEVQAGALIFGVLTGAILLTSGAALGLTAKFSELRVQLEKNNISMGKTALIGAAVGIALAGIVTVIALIAAEQAAARAKAEAYADTLEEGTNRITAATRDMAKEALAAKRSFLWLEQDSAYDAAEKLGVSLDLITDAATGNVDALKTLQGTLKGMEDGSYDTANAIVTIEQAVKGESSSLAAAIAVAEQKNRVTDEGVDVTKTAAEAYLEAADGADELASQISELIDKINEANGVGQDAVSANAAYQEALAGISEEAQRQRDEFEQLNGTLDGFSLSLNEGTEAGSANAAMLADVAGKAQDAAQKQYELDLATMSSKDATDIYAGTLAAQRQAFIDSAIQAGYNADEVQKLADKVFALPPKTELEILADTAGAVASIEDVRNRINSLPWERRINIVVAYPNGKPLSDGQIANQFGIGMADGGKVEFFASGGRSEHHVAQFARAGEYRVWAEKETGGEWYIPAAMAKRERSTQVLAQAADEFGYALVPKGAQSYAEGSPTSGGQSVTDRGSLVSFAGATFYAYDPHQVGREAGERLSHVLDAHGI